MPSDCLMLLQLDTYHSMYNAFFMDLPVSSFVSHSSLLTAKDVDLALAFPLPEVIHIFHSSYFDCRGAFRDL